MSLRSSINPMPEEFQEGFIHGFKSSLMKFLPRIKWVIQDIYHAAYVPGRVKSICWLYQRNRILYLGGYRRNKDGRYIILETRFIRKGERPDLAARAFADGILVKKKPASKPVQRSSKPKPNPKQSGPSPAMKEYEPLISYLIECARNATCVVSYGKDGNECAVFERDAGKRLFWISLQDGIAVLHYFAPVDRFCSVRESDWHEMKCDEVKWIDIWNAVKPATVFYECSKRGVLFRTQYVNNPLSMPLKASVATIPLRAKIELVPEDFLDRDHIMAIIPILRDDGAVYYPDYPVRCKYSFEKGRYMLPFDFLKGLLPFGKPQVMIREYATKGEWAEHSILSLCGYSVRSTPGTSRPKLSAPERRAILKTVIESSFIEVTADRVCEYLRFFIKNASGNSRMENAVLRWMEDLSFVENTYHPNRDK